MQRDSRETRNAFPLLNPRLPLFTLVFLLLLVVAIAIFIYQISPLRDPSFQPNSANAGSLIPWMRGVSENTWMLSAAVLASLLSSNLAIVFWQWSKPRRSEFSQFFRAMFWVGGGAVMFILLYLIFVLYLLAQWIVD
jgi:hypothetical protein